MAITPNKYRQNSRHYCMLGTLHWGQLFPVLLSYSRKSTLLNSSSVINYWWIRNRFMPLLTLLIYSDAVSIQSFSWEYKGFQISQNIFLQICSDIFLLGFYFSLSCPHCSTSALQLRAVLGKPSHFWCLQKQYTVQQTGISN